MNLTEPIFSVHYSPGMLTVLRRRPCLGQRSGFGGIQHSSCGCDKTRSVFTIAGIPTLLQNGEQDWVLERSWVR